GDALAAPPVHAGWIGALSRRAVRAPTQGDSGTAAHPVTRSDFVHSDQQGYQRGWVGLPLVVEVGSAARWTSPIASWAAPSGSRSGTRSGPRSSSCGPETSPTRSRRSSDPGWANPPARPP